MAKTRFIYTTDETIVPGATELRPQQIPNPPSPPERFSDDENVSKILHLNNNDTNLVFALVKGAEITFAGGPAVIPVYTLYVYDPSDTIFSKINDSFRFVPSSNGWSKFEEIDSGDAVKVINGYKKRRPIGPEELNIYEDELFVLANTNNQTILLQLNFNTAIINMNIDYDFELEIKYEFIEKKTVQNSALGNRQEINRYIATDGCGSHVVSTVDNYADRRSDPIFTANSDDNAFLNFWNDNFVLSDAQKELVYNREFSTNYGSRIQTESFVPIIYRDVYCLEPNYERVFYICGYTGPVRPALCFDRKLRSYTVILKGQANETAVLKIVVPTLAKYTTFSARTVIVGADPLIKKIICFDDYKKVYAICSKEREPNNSLYRIT